MGWCVLYHLRKEKVISIAKGKVINIADVENYVDDPKAIDRRNKDKINEVLFKKLKKVKWKNADDCDCSEKYLVTIDSTGSVSKVKMLQYLADEKVAEEWQTDETKYCIKTVFDALKKLRFDVIKDKGKPFAEDIYIQIWIDDGKIENWTR
jgi:hypothetical protein